MELAGFPGSVIGTTESIWEGLPLDSGVRPKPEFGITGKHLHGVRGGKEVKFAYSVDPTDQMCLPRELASMSFTASKGDYFGGRSYH